MTELEDFFYEYKRVFKDNERMTLSQLKMFVKTYRTISTDAAIVGWVKKLEANKFIEHEQGVWWVNKTYKGV